MNKKNILPILCLLLFPIIFQAGNRTLERQLQQFAANLNAQVGIAVILNGQDTITVNNDCRYPLMSVFKLHQALAVADYCQKEGLSFDTPVYIYPEDLKPDTYSPLREKYPAGNVSLTIKDLLKYTLHLSDNNACDILFSITGGPEATDQYIRGLGLQRFAIQATEDDMHKSIENCYLNWSTPLETAKMIELLLTKELFDKEYQDFIKQAMITCQTGKDRLAFPLEETKAIIGHKTGTGDLNNEGKIIGINDVGFVLLPNGKRYTIVVFIKDSAENASVTSQIIADISQMVYKYACKE